MISFDANVWRYDIKNSQNNLKFSRKTARTAATSFHFSYVRLKYKASFSLK